MDKVQKTNHFEDKSEMVRDDLKKDFGIDLSKKKELKHYIDMRIDLLLS